MEPIKNFRVRHEKVGSSQSKDSRHKKSEKKASSKEKSMDANHNKKTFLPHKNKALTLKAEPEDKLKIRGSTIAQNNNNLKQIEDMKNEDENLKDKALSIIKSHHTNKILTLSNEQITISQKNLINIISQYLGEIKKCETKISELKKERRKKQSINKILKSVAELITEIDHIVATPHVSEGLEKFHIQVEETNTIENLKRRSISEPGNDEIPYQSIIFVKKWNDFFINCLEQYCSRRNLQIQVDDLSKQNNTLKGKVVLLNQKIQSSLKLKDSAIVDHLKSITELKDTNNYLSAKVRNLEKIWLNETFSDEKNMTEIKKSFQIISEGESRFLQELRNPEIKDDKIKEIFSFLTHMFSKIKSSYEQIIQNLKKNIQHLSKQLEVHSKKLQYYDAMSKKRKSDVKEIHNILQKIAHNRSRILQIQKSIQNNEAYTHVYEIFGQINNLFSQISTAIDSVLHMVSFTQK